MFYCDLVFIKNYTRGFMMIIMTSIICGTFFLSILSVLTYFAAFHETRKFEALEKRINTLEQQLKHDRDELTQIDNKINFRGHTRL